MILNAEKLAQRIGPFDEVLYAELLEWCQDFQDTIADLQRQLIEAEKRGWDKCAEDEDRQINVECEKAIHAELDTLGVPRCGGSIVRIRWLADNVQGKPVTPSEPSAEGSNR